MKDVLDVKALWDIQPKLAYFGNIIRKIKPFFLAFIHEHLSSYLMESENLPKLFTHSPRHFFDLVFTWKFYRRRNNNKVDSIEKRSAVIAHLLPWRKVHVHHAFLNNDDKTLSSLLSYLNFIVNVILPACFFERLISLETIEK